MPRASRRVFLVLSAGLAAGSAASADREPVLKQIQVPHPYYYREMYLPQATSGPSALAWSPDGRELVYSMQGTLWRQTLGSNEARQLTSGPGYDYQPDWSPDGRFVAYASYRDDAVELWLLELSSGARHPLTTNRAVNVEPRFSPDGTKIAFVSTVYNQRWHVHTLDLAGGRPGRQLRLTEDNESSLPRYYYSRFDHFLSPAWSPDGSELLIVSNRGHVWGSGGFWRMKAVPGAPAREIRYEETTWRARPDWSRDGRRVVYASYLGRQWHQLWLMTDEGGDPFPITYGDHDATAPRFSPDGRKIAYVSNEGGDTALRVLDLPGVRRRVEVLTRRYLGPVGRLAVDVVDAGGRPIPARVSVTAADGRSFAPDDAWRHADDAFDRTERKIEYGYFHTRGRAELTVPAGPVTVEVTRGLEYRPVRRALDVPPDGSREVRVSLERLDDLPARGWYSGDMHVHMNYGGAYRNDPKRLALQAAAEDVHLVYNLIVNKEQRVPDVAYFRGAAPDPASTADTLILHGEEYHTSYWGHTGLLGLAESLLIPPYAAYANTAAASLHPLNATIADLARAQGALFGYVHPFDTAPDPARADEALTNELPVDAALGKLDYYEAVGFSDHRATSEVWYRLLNCGFRIPAGAGTDAMANFASLRGPVGMNRAFARSGALDERRWRDAVRAGRTFATNGPLLDLTVGGKDIGDELRLAAGTHTVEARVRLRSIVPVDRLEIVGNGRVVAALPLAADRTSAELTHALKVERSGWYVLRAHAERARHPVLDIYPFATTSPVYVTVGDAPVRSPEDAAFFARWISRLEDAARAHTAWNTPEEKDSALALLGRARAVYVERGAR